MTRRRVRAWGRGLAAALVVVAAAPAAGQEEAAAPDAAPAPAATPPAPASADGAAAAPPQATQEGEVKEAEAEEDEIEELDPAIFDIALKRYYAQDYTGAAELFYKFVNLGEPTLDNYEWAQFFLAECMRALGLWHAAVQYYTIVAKTRSRPEILPDAMRRLEAISRRRPFSETLVFEDLIYDSEFGNLPPDLDQWVHYVQGLYDYRNGFIDWAERHFEQVPEDSYYGLKALYVRAVYALQQGQDDKAQVFFEKVTESKVDAPDVKNEAHLALARLLFDLGAYREALSHYEQVLQINLSFQQAQLLLEKAWTHYQLQEYRKAMGLLHALLAPSYQKYFLPDSYVLRALILKDLCHFIPAKRAARAFRFDYGRTLDELRQRIPLEKSPRLFEGATQEGPIAERTAFLRTLMAERKRIEDYDSSWDDVGLDHHLRRLYDLEAREQARLWKLQFDRSADEAALLLLETEEQVNLLDYEIGLDIFKRVKGGTIREARAEKLVVPYDSRNVYYEFDTEYWNDELHSYQYFITSRCLETVED